MKRLLLALGCVGILLHSPSYADNIIVSGNVSGTWSTGDSVTVVGDITVPGGESLAIEPGVIVLFTGRYRFNINGLLLAAGSESDPVTFTRAEETEESKWRGFRFDGADDSSLLEYCLIEWAKGDGAYPDVRGGGIWINNCSPTVRFCTIQNNYTHNANYNGAGGGICLNENSTSVIENNHILMNEADSGGGILVGWECDPVIRNNLIEDNEAFYAGGGIYVSANGRSSIENNVILSNNSGGWGGGGINLWSATWLYGTFSTLDNNLIVGNTASDAGGGIYSRYDTSLLTNNTISENQANRGGGVYVLTFDYLPPVLHNDILWNDTAPLGQEIYLDPAAGSEAVITYSDVEGGWAGSGNIDEDPLFSGQISGEFDLSPGSPCIDSGDPVSDVPRGGGCRIDMGAYEFWKGFNCRKYRIPAMAF
jgi:parallel beta-helix repeat protein